MQPPRLKNDCFALPPGVDWTPVDDALGHLREALQPVTEVSTVALAGAAGLFLAEDAIARRAHPPAANSAVDGYGFAHAATGQGVQILPLVEGRAAAGAPFTGAVLAGMAIRILTGAILPEGVDTVVLEEDVTAEDGRIAFHGGLKPGANARKAGEDIHEGAVAVPAGHRLRAQELGLLASVGVGEVVAHRALRVGVLSTGDEVVDVSGAAATGQIFDANRPMLLSLLAEMGCVPVDLGHARDDAAALSAQLDAGAAQVDVILTSGGASAGDEDHVSALLSETGSMGLWRIAVKPGRPLAMGMWRGVPVFGLPGNPVAAFVCTLVFGAPAFRLLAGGRWRVPSGVMVPAAFSKNKKPGRREYLRARLVDGAAAVFASEGSGRISGLSWAEGLVELPDGAVDVGQGDPVRYIAFSDFTL
ncbi:Molybdopterin biosynthesis protein MoeA [Candidatus Rhodobacter oscarellae]|uniref:Molybdopterin molybdenumtransferase n=1 Tax=Candidatus Rhodobacter oscarellae TaxID=1675527 RepID=A0A0J9E4P3_9RHOB|nr:gephyrin-like molybdotransferase Glp [Candidatus Rhodobacter lobularis]KMW57716.1 Molybdopterin biosynthesis protein MoeA [Candidatus Rhodobacter lobularis]